MSWGGPDAHKKPRISWGGANEERLKSRKKETPGWTSLLVYIRCLWGLTPRHPDFTYRMICPISTTMPAQRYAMAHWRSTMPMAQRVPSSRFTEVMAAMHGV